MEQFLAQLFETGELQVPRDATDVDINSVRKLLSDAELIWRQNQPLTPPGFNPDVALAATQVLLAACQAVVYRETEVEDTQHIISESRLLSPDAEADPSKHYSADFLLRFMPQVIERASRTAESDPLLEVLYSAIEPWPLSSVGICRKNTDAVQSGDDESITIPPALLHPSLWRMYIDRIIAMRDTSRLANPQIRGAVDAAIGLYDFLAPEMASHRKNTGNEVKT